MRKMDSNITLTIEQRLKVYSEVENHTERHETYGMNGITIKRF